MTTYQSLKDETRNRRRKKVLTNKTETDARINQIATRATTDNPVSVLNLAKVTDFVRHCLVLGATDDEAEAATRKFIQQIEGNPVE